jgi:PAS domain S-box-containing protein
MRSYIFTDWERGVIESYLLKSFQSNGFSVLKSRIYDNFPSLIQDIIHINTMIEKLSHEAPPGISEARDEMINWMLDYLSSIAEKIPSVDVEESLELKEKFDMEHRILLQAFNSAGSALLVIDVEGRILAVNKAFQWLFDIRKGNIIGRNLDSIFNLRITRIFRYIREKITEEGRVRDIFYVKEGTALGPRWLDISAIQLMNNGNHIATSVTLRDITDRRQLEERIKILVEQLHER